jgi:hypothetical protein
MICFILGYGIYEVGALFHNLSVMNKAVSSSANYATRGASYSKVQNQLIQESENLIGGVFLEQTITSDPGVVLEVWNPETNTKLGASTKGNHTYRPQCSESFPPHENGVTPYLFWAQGYVLKVGVNYKIGVYIPFIGLLSVDTTIADAKRIVTSNDIDRDGMVDTHEAEYVDWAMTKKAKAGVSSDTKWVNPVHRDEISRFDTAEDPSLDIDGDSIPQVNDTAPYDANNNNVEDRFDKAEKNDRNNHLTMNPLIGPGVVPNQNSNKWWNGSCPF